MCLAQPLRCASRPIRMPRAWPIHGPGSMVDSRSGADKHALQPILGEGLRFDLKTKAPPEQVLRALTDFTDARLQIWNRTLDPKTYELRDSGETWAVARESSRRSPFSVVVRYDWSDPESVRWTVLDSSYGGGGEGLDSTGRRWGQPRARRVGLHRSPRDAAADDIPDPTWAVRRLIKRMWASALDRYAESSRR
jgi:hypothetical protein